MLTQRSVLSYKLVRNVRLLSTSIFSCDAAKKSSPKKPTSFNPRHLGVTNEVYIPPSSSNLPSFFVSPIIVMNALIRRMYTFGLNTVQVALFRYQSGFKPNFLLWKNNAIENYVQVNKAFADKDINAIKSNVSIWVEEALIARSKQVPEDVKLSWELVKFNAIPKLVSTQVIMIPGRPLELIQLIYKFDTKQRLIKLNKSTNKAEKLDKTVVDYIAFICDATNDDMLLIGSLFESNPESKLPKDVNTDTQTAIRKMKSSGDIYRAKSL